MNALCPGYVDTPLVRNQIADLAATRNVPLDRVVEEVIYSLVPQRRLLADQEIALLTCTTAQIPVWQLQSWASSHTKS